MSAIADLVSYSAPSHGLLEFPAWQQAYSHPVAPRIRRVWPDICPVEPNL
jgi:hypothetical protein